MGLSHDEGDHTMGRRTDDARIIEDLARRALEAGGRVLGISQGESPAPDPGARHGATRGLADVPGAKALVTRLPGARTTTDGRVHTITIPLFRPATLNQLTKRGNVYSASRLKRLDRETVARHSEGVPAARGRRRVSLEVVRSGRMRECDPDAFFKSILDAMSSARLLIDDSPRWLEIGSVVQRKGDEVMTVITLEDLD